MAPQAVTNPERRFVITRLDGGVETNVAISALLPVDYTSDQTIRAVTYASIRSLVGANPGIRYRVYSPANNGTAHTDDDCIWDSALNAESPF